MRVALFLAAFLALCSAAPAVAGSPIARVEVPIRRVVLSNGERRFVVTLRIAGREVEAGLDSGSTGLRVLPRALPPEAIGAKGEQVRYSYGSGVTFAGRAISVPVGIGASGDIPVRIQRVDKLGCKPEKPDCAGVRVPIETFGIQGDGLQGEGFAAILGVGLKDDPVPNTLQALGARRWIIDLPRPGDAAPGRLILNPDDAEIATYRSVKMLSDDGNTIAGCIAFEAPEKPICGPARLDTGAPGLRVVDGGRHAPVAQGTPARLVIGDRSGGFGVDVVIGRREQASRLTFEQDPRFGQTQLFFGLAPYFAWSILYDPGARTIGLKAR